MKPACLRTGFVPALVLLLSATSARAQEGELVRAPLPPQRPFDLDLEGTPKLPDIVVPPAAPAAAPSIRAASQETPPASRTTTKAWNGRG